MRRIFYLLILVFTFSIGGCDFFGSDKEGGSGNPDGGDNGGESGLVVERDGG